MPKVTWTYLYGEEAGEGAASQLSKRFERETLEIFQARKSGQSTGSQKYSQIAPSPQKEQWYTTGPFSIFSPKLQNSAGLIYFSADFDRTDDACHPLPL